MKSAAVAMVVAATAVSADAPMGGMHGANGTFNSPYNTNTDKVRALSLSQIPRVVLKYRLKAGRVC
jgi:hypothetical protein